MKSILFYPTISCLTAIDLMVNTALIWSSLQITGSPLLIGIILSVSVVIPFALKQIFINKNLDKSKQNRASLKNMLYFRMLGYFLIGGLFYIFGQPDITLIIATAFITGIVNYITISQFEAQNTLYVLSGEISRSQAARFVETAIQVGAALGAFLGGMLIAKLTLYSFMFITATIGIIFSMIPFCFLQFMQKKIIHPSTNIPTLASHTPNSIDRSHLMSILMFSLGLGIIGFHIGAFNTLIPVVYQKVNIWPATFLGTASAIAGLGALTASLVTNNKKFIPYLILAIGIIDTIVVSTKIPWLSTGICFLLGFSINYIRIAIREQLIHYSINEYYAHRIASLSMFNYLFFRGFSPLIASVLISKYLFGIHYASAMFIFIGICSSIILLGILFLPKNTPIIAEE